MFGKKDEKRSGATEHKELPGIAATLAERSPEISDSEDAIAGQTPVDGDHQTSVTGRAVFAVQTSHAGVVVRTAFLTADSRLLDMPAVFPDIQYAMNVLDDLKAQVMQHFSRAAQVGAQVIASQSKQEQEGTEPSTKPSTSL